MNYHHFKLTYAATRTVVAAVVVATLVFAAVPVFAAKTSEEARIEARIKDLHAKLKITPVEEDQWAKVSDVMRDNAKKMDQLTEARMANVKSMNAIEDLKSYGEITEAHADAIRKFTPVFATLYDSMSNEQKTGADELFREGPRQQRSKNGGAK
ncbi:MAG: Spy/CpxP family protein refolding chaperone [Burkholderiales bacterium]|nr:Spy/CpxP family protein refolding chaperone [Ferrovum sp.]